MTWINISIKKSYKWSAYTLKTTQHHLLLGKRKSQLDTTSYLLSCLYLKKNKRTNVDENGEIGTLMHCFCEYKMVWSLWKMIWCLLKKLNIIQPRTYIPRYMPPKNYRVPQTLQHYSQWPNCGKNPTVYQEKNR